MTDTSKPESVKLDEYKKTFDKKDKKNLSPTQMRKKDKKYVPKNVLEKYPKVKFGDGEIMLIDSNSNISLSEGPEFKAKGGRAGYKSGGRGCKLAMKGKGRAYGKNS